MKENEDDTPIITRCPHFSKIVAANPTISHYSYIKPTIKGWVCLKDGCCRKQGNLSMIKQDIYKFEADHKVLMEMSRLEIYCFECDFQITDDQQQLTYQIRKLAMPVDKEQQRTLFGANIEYPPGFHKQKAGIAGTVGTELTSYINAVIQLLAHLSPFYQICEATDLKSIKDQCLLQAFLSINKIRSGIYRIVETKAIEKQLLLQNPNFRKYSYKTPSLFIYEILRAFSQQFQYKGVTCQSGKILQALAKQVIASSMEIYTPMKQLFAGQFIWNLQCSSCQKMKTKRADFECLRLEFEDPASLKGTKILEELIQNIFNFSKLFKNTFSKEKVLECQQTQNCKFFTPIQDKCYAKMPNILLLQFLDEDGFHIQYPDVLDLTKFTNSPQEEYKYSYVGSIGKHNKKYFTHVREFKTGTKKEYIFQDSLIKQDAVRTSKAVIAIYKLEVKQKNRDLAKNIQSSIIVNIDCIVPLPDFWNFYLADLRRVQTLVNPFICIHGQLAPLVKSKTKNPCKIPPAIYQYLIQQFGGMPTKTKRQEQYCQICLEKKKIIKQLKQSEKEMAKFADQLSNKKSKVCVDVRWFDKWKKYLYENEEESYGQELYRRPGPIDNKAGLLKNGDIDESKYKKVSPEVWYFFKKFYGGGPLIAKNPLPPSLALTQAVDLRFEKIKIMMKQFESLP